MVKVIIVTGSVCSGKSVIAKKISEKLKYKYVDVNEIISKNPFVVAKFDKERDTKEIYIEKLNKILVKLIKDSKRNLVIDSHLSHYLPKKYVDLCLVTICDLKILKKRLEKRKYSELKIKENLEAEALESCFVDALELGHNVYKIDTSKKVDIDKVIDGVKKRL